MNGYRQYLLGKQWAQIRRDALAKAGHKCEECGAEGEPLDVHHRSYVRLYQERPEDLIVLCKTCHEAKHDLQPA